MRPTDLTAQGKTQKPTGEGRQAAGCTVRTHGWTGAVDLLLPPPLPLLPACRIALAELEPGGGGHPHLDAVCGVEQQGASGRRGLQGGPRQLLLSLLQLQPQPSAAQNNCRSPQRYRAGRGQQPNTAAPSATHAGVPAAPSRPQPVAPRRPQPAAQRLLQLCLGFRV